jgi:glycosyltransferase involved in cell wall biosynthesis
LISWSAVYHDVSRANKSSGITLLRPAFIRIPVFSRVSAFVSYFFLIEQAIRKYKIDHIILFAAPTNGMQTILMAKKYRIPVLFRSLDVLHQIVPHKLLEFPTTVLERFVYTFVDRISAITPKLVEYTVKRGAKPENCSYLPTGADADIFFHQPKDKQLLARLGLGENNLILLFSGTLYNFSGLTKIIRAIPRYLSELPDLKLLLVGRGEQSDELIRLIGELGLEKHVIMTGFVDYREVPKYINLADICINPFDVNEITNIIFPSKVYQYLACEKPVIATKLTGMLDIFPLDKQNHGVYYFDTDADFFDIVCRIKNVKVKSSSPTLQEITTCLEQELKSMGLKKSSGGVVV